MHPVASAAMTTRWRFKLHASLAQTSQIFSSVDIHDVARWQFCSTTHEPSFTPLSIIFMAIGPWPWPRDSETILPPPKPCATNESSWLATGQSAFLIN